MRVLLTGAAGFIGSHLSDRLLAEGHEVLGVDNLITGRLENIAHLRDHPRFRFHQADVCIPLDVDGRFDWVMHFASPASPPKYLAWPVETLLTNAEGTRHLLDLAEARGARFFLASTSEVYGDPQVHPQPESYWGMVNPVGPRSVYDEGKRYAESITTAYQTTGRVDTRIIRIFNTYGPRMDPADGRVVTNFGMQALQNLPITIYGDGLQTRSFQFVSDLVDGVWRLMNRDVHGPVNLGNPEEFTMIELAEALIELTGSTSRLDHHPLPIDDPRQRRPDISRARELLGWAPVVPLREGLPAVIDYLRKGLAG